MNYRYVLIRSWHVIADEVGSHIHTRCGRDASAWREHTADVMPYDGKSCETCARLVLRDQDRS